MGLNSSKTNPKFFLEDSGVILEGESPCFLLMSTFTLLRVLHMGPKQYCENVHKNRKLSFWEVNLVFYNSEDELP